jgi:hypothetical protein
MTVMLSTHDDLTSELSACRVYCFDADVSWGGGGVSQLQLSRDTSSPLICSSSDDGWPSGIKTSRHQEFQAQKISRAH